MATTETARQARMHVRLDTLSKQKPEQAADAIIQEHESIVLDEADREVFSEAFENPSKPDVRLRRAFAEYRKHVRQ